MLSRVTVNIRLPDDKELLKTMNAYQLGLRHCIDVAWDKRIRNNIKLHPFVYRHLRRTLPAQLSCACIKQACGMVKKAKSRPMISRCSMRFNPPRSFSYKHGILSLITVAGRKKFNVPFPSYASEYSDWKINESLVWTDRRNRIFFGMCLSKDIDVNMRPAQHRRILGIDVGIKHLAVTSDKRFYGSIVPKMIRHQNVVSALQSKGTKSAKRHLKRLSGRWTRFMRSENHRISREIVNRLKEGDIVSMENLTGIRSNKGRRFNRTLHSWAFRQLQGFVEYKALKAGCPVVYIDPSYTSKTCRRCGEIGTRTQGFFKCGNCGYSCNSDLNAAFNIRTRAKPLALALGLNVNEPIVTTDDGIYCVFEHCESPDVSCKPPNLFGGS